jgi:hypothetical protein
MGVAQHAQQVSEVVLAAQQAGLGQHARVRVLNEVLGVLARSAEAPCRPVQPVNVIPKPLGLQLTIATHPLAAG